MKYTLLTMFFAVGIVFKPYAQITLTNTDYPTVTMGADTMKISVYNSTFPVLNPTGGGMWDMTILTDSVTDDIKYTVPSATYQYADSPNVFSIGQFNNTGIIHSSIGSSGILSFGSEIMISKFDLFPFTSGSTDTLYIPSQNTIYTSPANQLAFPTSFGSNWSSEYTSDVVFELSYALFGFYHAPGYKRSYVLRTDTVTGWGQMRVKNADGSPSVYFDVLQVQTTTITTDSFFINGAPANGSIMLLLGATQGIKDTSYTQQYYRTREVRPLALVEYADATFTQPRKATIHRQRLFYNDLPLVKHNATQLKTYPNPITSGCFEVALPDNQSKYEYSLIDISGKVLERKRLQPQNGKALINVGADIPFGTYSVFITGNDAFIGAQQIIISN